MVSENGSPDAGSPKRLLVLYGSQTGCAEEVAERVAREAAVRRLSPILMSMEEYDVRILPSETHAVFVCSTTGQGDAPDSMRAFWAFLLRKSLPADSLSTLKYATFGLGDSGYTKFNAAAKRLDRRLESLGGHRLLPLGLGDDQDTNGYDQALDPWLELLWKELLTAFPLPHGMQIDTTRSLPAPRYMVKFAEGCISTSLNDATSRYSGRVESGAVWSAEMPFMSRVVSYETLTGEGAEKEVMQFDLDVEGSGISFQPGDSVAVQPRNRPEDVAAFAQEVGLDPLALIEIRPSSSSALDGATLRSKTPVCGWGVHSIQHVLSTHCDIMGTPRRYFFHMLSFFCTDKVQQERLEEFASAEGRDDLYSYCQKQRRTFLEVFRDFPAARPPIEYLLDLVPRLQPRYYSISSGPSVSPTRLSITASIVQYVSKTKMPRYGVCTNFLKQRGEALKTAESKEETFCVPVWIKPGSLTLPKRNKDADSGASQVLRTLEPPLVMVGPGTGLAPLRSFLQERAYARRVCADSGLQALGSKDLLFFGCRTKAKDFLYRQELEGYAASGNLSLLSVAFSRDQESKVYVQDKIKEEGQAVWGALEAGAIVMVCGSADKMPAGVRKSLVEVVRTFGDRGEDDAEMYVRELERSRRYLLDTWS